ncbi:MAG TPA: Fic family protein [Pyrinomonadaceae bacterium]|nr:Fic family protein [Pyrinomonadaceae bacterium]
MQKFRLDWNYHSNNIEGNSLTYGETKALILFGITAQGKPLKDHFEITGHNEAINWILEIVKDERPLTETFIRELHTLLLKESSYKEALTPEGKPTRRKIEVGKYKTQPNHVITVTGETFYFAAPEETPAKMQELTEWFKNEKEKTDVNPIILAALFHYRFIRIHPFDDGNGRVARILMNFILMQFGYPPVIIKTEDKENYYAVLRLADVGELQPFIEYIMQNLIRSLEIMIRGAKGESIEEPDDLDKELLLLEKKLNVQESGRITRNRELLYDFFNHQLSHLIQRFLEVSDKFKRFYLESEVFLVIDLSRAFKLKAITLNEIKEIFHQNIDDNTRHFLIIYKFKALKAVNESEINFDSPVEVLFGLTTYEIKLTQFHVHSDFNNIKEPIEKPYSQPLTEKEITDLVTFGVNHHKKFIEDSFEKFKVE